MQDAELVLAFVDDAAMRELNSRYRRKDRTTDVLSFGQSLPRGAKGTAAAASLRREADGTLELGGACRGGRAGNDAREGQRDGQDERARSHRLK